MTPRFAPSSPKTRTSAVTEVPVNNGGPSRTRILDPGGPEYRRAGRVAIRRQARAAVGDERSEERHDQVHERHRDHTASAHDDRRSDHDDHQPRRGQRDQARPDAQKPGRARTWV